MIQMGQFTMQISGPQKITKIYTGTYTFLGIAVLQSTKLNIVTKPTVGIVDQTSIPLLGSAGNV